MEEKEILNEFNEIINSFRIQLDHIQITNELSIKYLYDFPNKLPDEIQEAVDNDRDIVLEELRKSASLVTRFKSGYDSIIYMMQNPEEIDSGELQDSLSFSIVNLIEMKSEYEKLYHKTGDEFFDFEYTINSQSLLLINAILEGFLKQITEFIPKLDTSVKRKRIKTSLNKRLEFLENECGIEIMDNSHFLYILKFLEQLRHIIIYNNGIADQNFVNNTGITKQNIGERVKLHKQMLNIAGAVITTFVIDFSEKIIKKYFNKLTN